MSASVFLIVCVSGFIPTLQTASAIQAKPAPGALPGGEVIQRIEGHCASGVSQPAKTWYLPEGSTAWGFECWLLIQNPNPETATCHITYMIQGGSPIIVTKQVGATSRRSFNVADDIGSHDASIKVESDVPVIPERAMYKNDRREGSDSIGTTSPAKDYYLAEGTTNWGFTTYILVQNPNEASTTVMLTYMTDSGPQPQPTFSMGPNSRTTIRANDQITADFSTQVHGSSPIIAERAMYWGQDTPLGEACHDSIGVSAPSRTWYLAEGTTNGGFETWVMVQNPGNETVNAGIAYMTEAGPVTGPTLTLGPNSRKTVNVADVVPNNWSVSTMVTANGPVIAERSVYWNNRGGGHNSTGVSTPANQWYLAEGCTAGGFETWVLVQNPGDQASTVALTYMTPSGPIVGPHVDLSPHSRKTINVADTVHDNWSVSTQVSVVSGPAVIAERSMYWSKEISPPAPAPPPPPSPTFTYADYPVNPGLKNTYWSGSKYETIAVGGPWEMKSPVEDQETQSYIDPAANYAYGDFPGANAARVYTTPDFSISQFYTRETTYMNYLGYAEKEIVGYKTLKFNPPKLTYRFPFKVGDSWGSASTYTITGLNPGQGSLTSQSNVLACNTLKVEPWFSQPVTYNNCFLMQMRDTDTWTDGTVHVTLTYGWLVPGIGMVASGVGGEVEGSSFLLNNVAVKN